MAYTPETLHQLPSLIGGKVKLWTYETEDAIGSVDNTDYFAGAGARATSGGRGLAENNVVFVIDTNVGAVYLTRVSAVDSDGNATVEVTTTVAEQGAIASLTDNSGGSANDAIAEITNSANIGSADVAPTANAIADLAAKVNAILAALRSAGVIAT